MEYIYKLISLVVLLACAGSPCSIASAQTPSDPPANVQIDNGIKPNLSYDGLHDIVSLMSGNLTFCIPLVSLPGINGMNVSIPLCYNSQVNQIDPVIGGGYRDTISPFPWGNATPIGPGWTLTGRPITYANMNGDGGFFVLFPDGSKYGVPLHDGTDTSGQGIFMSGAGDPTQQTIHLKDGTRVVPSQTNAAISQVIDTNYNSISYTASSVSDTIGRVVNVAVTPNASGAPAAISFQYPASNGTATATVEFATSTYNCPQTSGNPGANGTYPMPSYIQLPNGLTYTFQYDSCGHLTKVTYPSGGYTRYTYTANTFASWVLQGTWTAETLNQDQVTSKFVCSLTSLSPGATSAAPGNTCPIAEEKTTYLPYFNSNDTNNEQNTVTDAAGNQTIVSFSQVRPLGNQWTLNAAETSRQVFTGSGGGAVLLKTVATVYNAASASQNDYPLLPVSQTVTLTNGMVSQTQWDYSFQSIYLGGDSPMTEKREYDFGPGSPGPLLRRTDYDWLQLDYPTEYDDEGSAYHGTGYWILDKKTRETIWDGNGNMVADTKSIYNSGNDPGSSPLMTARQTWSSTTASYLNTSYQYGGGGVVTAVTDPNGNTTSYSYADNFTDGENHNANAFITQITYPSTSGSPHVEQRQYYYGSGLLAASCGQNYAGACVTGKSAVPDYTSYQYDVMGRAVAIASGDGGTTLNCYSEIPGSACYSSSFPLTVASTDSIEPGTTKKMTAILDGLGRTTQSQLNSDPNCGSGTLVDTTYDPDERVSSKSSPYCSKSDLTYGVVTTSYDGMGRVTQVQNPDGTSAKSAYIGRDVLSADEGNGSGVSIQRISEKDGLGRLTAVCEVSGTTQQGTSNTPANCGLDYSGTGFLTTYQYDTLGNLTSANQGGISRTFAYDSLSRLHTAYNPESGTTKYSYDPDGNLISKTDQKGITTTYSYDPLNRLTGKSYTDGSTPSGCFQYDFGATNGTGRLVTEWTQAGACSSTAPVTGALTERTFAAYDLMGRVTTDQQCSSVGNCGASAPYAMQYGYDLAGDVSSFNNGLSGASAMAFSNAYDSAGRMSTLSAPAAPGGGSQPFDLFHAVDYTPAGAIQDAALGSGLTLHRDYDSRLRPIDEIDSVKNTPGVATVQITGAEQEIAASTGSITFGGSEQSATVNGQVNYDGGTFLVSINGANPYQINYGACDTPSTIAANVAADVGTSCAYGPVQATAVGATVYLTSCSTGANTNYPISVKLDGNSSYFPQASFVGMASGLTMVQAPPSTGSPSEPLGLISFAGAETSSTQSGSTTYDTGAFTIPFYYVSTGKLASLVTVGWGQGSTPQSIAASLISKLTPCSSGGLISGTQNGSAVTLTSCQSGTSFVENIGLDHGGPTPPSFSAEADTAVVTASGTYDAGTATLTLNGTQVASTSYGSSSTPGSIIAGLVSSSSNNGLVTLWASSANPSSLSITANGGTTDSGYNYALTFTYDTKDFTQASFAASSSSGSLTGGQNATVYSWAINSYAPNSDVLSMTDSVMGSWNYTYDDLNRLVSGGATAGPLSGLNLGWDYDRYGNRWDQNASGGSASATQPHFTFTGGNNRIDGFSYDVNGNLLNDGINNYTYDAENRISALNGQPIYVYDATGARVAKLGSGGAITSIYVLGSGGQQVTEVNGTGQWQHSNVYAAGGRLLATFTPSTAAYHYNLTDWLGTKRMQTLASGNQEETCVSYPFGDDLSCTGGSDATEQHFTGKDHDAESGLDYFGARYLSSNFGRWMTPDWADKPASVPYASYGDPQSLNLYAYVGNNPNTGIDADGHINESVQMNNADPSAQSAGAAGMAMLQNMQAAFDIAFGTTFLNMDDPEAKLVASIEGTQASGGQAQQQTDQTQATSPNSSDPIVNAVQTATGATATPSTDPNQQPFAKGGHKNETDTLTFKSPEAKAKFLAESGRKSLVPGDVSENGFGPGVRLPGGLHMETGHLDAQGNLVVTSHIDRFNPNNGLGPMVGHAVVDVFIGTAFFRHSAGLD